MKNVYKDDVCALRESCAVFCINLRICDLQISHDCGICDLRTGT